MSQITWDSSYSVGIQKIDEQHKKLINLINHLDAAVGKGQGSAMQGDLIMELAEYLMDHFGMEEALMDKYGYPQYDAHLQIHHSFTRKVKEFRDDIAAGSLSVSEEALVFLGDWLINHIQATDKLLGDYLREQAEV